MLTAELKLTKPTANGIIKAFIDLKNLKELSGKKRNRLYFFEEYFELFR